MENSTQFTKKLAELFLTDRDAEAVQKKESHERQWLEEIYFSMLGPFLQTGVANAKWVIADEWQRASLSWVMSYETSFRMWLVVEQEQQARKRITDQSIVAVDFLSMDERICRGRLKRLPRVPVPRDALGVALTYWSPPRFDQDSPTPYMYHTLRHGDLEGTWADAISSAYELWEGRYSPLGSATWYYNGGELDVVLARSLAYDPLRPVRLRITTTERLVEQLPLEFSGTFVIECPDVRQTLDSLAALPNTTGLVVPSFELDFSTEDLFASTARFPALQHLKVCIKALERPVELPIFPCLRAFCCDILSDRTESHFGESIADAFPNLEVLHYCSPDGTLAKDLLRFGRLRRLRVLLLRLSVEDHPSQYQHHVKILCDTVPGVRIAVSRRHREKSLLRLTNKKWFYHLYYPNIENEVPRGEAIDCCQVCPHQPLAQSIFEAGDRAVNCDLRATDG